MKTISLGDIIAEMLIGGPERHFTPQEIASAENIFAQARVQKELCEFNQQQFSYSDPRLQDTLKALKLPRNLSKAIELVEQRERLNEENAARQRRYGGYRRW